MFSLFDLKFSKVCYLITLLSLRSIALSTLAIARLVRMLLYFIGEFLPLAAQLCSRMS
jgi:hypothetical protein